MVDWSVKVSKRYDHVERNIIEFPNHVKIVKNENDRISDETSVLRRQSLKSNGCEKCNSLRNKVESLHEFLIKFTKGKDNLDIIDQTKEFL